LPEHEDVMIRTMPLATPTHPLIGAFFFLGAVALAVAPLPILFRDLGIIFIAYLAFVLARPSVAYMIVVLAPPLGLLGGSPEWLIMQPLVISSGLLAMLGLEYAWRYPAIVVSPLLYLLPYLVAWQLSRQELFAVELPFAPSPEAWLTLHGLVALAGVLLALYINRRREKRRQ
jgi:hypothetical protein